MEQDNSSESIPRTPPSPLPDPKATMTQSGHIQRELPTVRQVHGDRFNKNLTEEALTINGEDAKKALTRFNADVKARYDEVKAEFADWDAEVSPIKDPEFLSFIRGQLAYANMSYVTMGTFPADVRKSSADSLPEEAAEQLGQLSPELRDHPAVLLALQDGAQLMDSLDGEE